MCKCCISGWLSVAIETVCSSLPSGWSWNTLVIWKMENSRRGQGHKAVKILFYWLKYVREKSFVYVLLILHCFWWINKVVTVIVHYAGSESHSFTCCTCGFLAKEILARAWVCRFSCCPVNSPSSISTRPAQVDILSLKTSVKSVCLCRQQSKLAINNLCPCQLLYTLCQSYIILIN